MPRFASSCAALLCGAVCCAALLAGTGCGTPRAEYHAGGLDIARHGWDSLDVTARFVRRTTFGQERVRPDTFFVSIFSAAHDTLYAGSGASATVPDAALGDAEPLLVEACGTFGPRTICEQERLRASPKRVQAEPRIEYPLSESRLEQGRYRLHFVVERRRFGGEGWERLHPQPRPTGYLLAYVQDRRAEAVRIPFSGTEGRFDLSRLGGYDDFRFSLRSQLFSREAALVVFDVYAGLGGHARPVSRVARAVRMKTEAERAEVVRTFARQATEALAQRLDEEAAPKTVVAYVDEWTYDRFQRTYAAEVEMRWRGGHRGRDWHTLAGTLRVDAEGEAATFEIERANRDARRRWRRHAKDAQTLALGSLDPEPPAAENTASDAVL